MEIFRYGQYRAKSIVTILDNIFLATCTTSFAILHARRKTTGIKCLDEEKREFTKSAERRLRRRWKIFRYPASGKFGLLQLAATTITLLFGATLSSSSRIDRRNGAFHFPA